MNENDIFNDTNYSVRTQISLSPSLYRQMKKWAKQENKSLAALVRDLALEKAKKEKAEKKKNKKRVEDLIERIKGSIKPGDGGWGDVKNPTKLIRDWRVEEDRVLSKRLGWHD